MPCYIFGVIGPDYYFKKKLLFSRLADLDIAYLCKTNKFTRRIPAK
jgi:hypothetical protein